MRWQELDVLPALDELVLIWVDEAPRLARRTEGPSSTGWEWVEETLEQCDTWSPATPIRWAVIPAPQL